MRADMRMDMRTDIDVRIGTLPTGVNDQLYIGSILASPTACLLRGYGRAIGDAEIDRHRRVDRHLVRGAVPVMDDGARQRRLLIDVARAAVPLPRVLAVPGGRFLCS